MIGRTRSAAGFDSRPLPQAQCPGAVISGLPCSSVQIGARAVAPPRGIPDVDGLGRSPIVGHFVLEPYVIDVSRSRSRPRGGECGCIGQHTRPG
jgi:hypothetical protein